MNIWRHVVVATIAGALATGAFISTSRACSRCSGQATCEPDDSATEICQIVFADQTCSWQNERGEDIGLLDVGFQASTRLHCKSRMRCEAVASCQPRCPPSGFGEDCTGKVGIVAAPLAATRRIGRLTH